MPRLRRTVPPHRETLSLTEARRVALAAQGFAETRPRSSPGRGPITQAIERLGLLQIDSVNVLVRSHYLPLFSRLGNYEVERLDRLAYGRRPRWLFEYWGHEASLIPVALQPLLRWRMERARQGLRSGDTAHFGRKRRAYIEAVLAEVEASGPLSASELTDGGRARGSWWGWSDGKRALEWLFWAGLVTTAARRGFERLYDLPERVLPPEIVRLPTPKPEEAQRRLIEIAARALGIASEPDLRDYFRLAPEDSKARVAELAEAGSLRPVQVKGWKETVYLHAEAKLPRRIEARALLSPFDSLVWRRPRAELLFDFHYRLALYTPAPKREHGYYVLPFLLGDRLVARVDLKAERKEGVLQVQAAHCEGHCEADWVAPPLLEELRLMADWLGLERVAVRPRGAVAEALAKLRPPASPARARPRPAP
ncbi:MAG: YcaQ family DNA glycosylase [Proteobacteria bacterium]|nr:YcaQ family DNA glycosylase [Pseudomonadota bacterium]MBI3499782.1 YcaQ family DNA glycosylase [Pseudomonadota bacterium]